MRLCPLVRGFSVAATLVFFSMLAHANPLRVRTKQGEVQGETINDGRVKAWLGIPYAAPPIGPLRWKAPQPPARWKGVRDATKFGAHCAQNHVYDDMIFPDNGGSEDCLFLNIYAPATARARSNLPVMFWIYGGGFIAGSSDEPRYNGDFLPLKGVILVTINYRLGVFGFLATSDLAREAGGTAGNYGLMDMVAALEWVKANIRDFGGDPANVTIFGESAGSFAVSTLMAAPSAQGLFEKAIGESGSAVGKSVLTYEPLSVRMPQDDKWEAGLHVHSLDALRALPTETILAAARSTGLHFVPDIDGRLLTEPVADTYAAGKQAHVPLLAGWNSDEDGAPRDLTAEEFRANAAKLYPDDAEEFLRLFPAQNDAEAYRSAIDYSGDAFIAFSTWSWLEAQRKTGESSVYRYHFELAALPSKYHSGTFAFHSDEIEYVFGTLATRPGETWRPEDRALSQAMMSYWTNFAKTGDPNGPGLPEWPKYNDADYPVLHLNATILASSDTLRDRYLFLAKHPGSMPASP